MSSQLLRLDSVSKTFRKRGAPVNALHNVNLTIDEGQFVAVQGPSGCGKTTLLFCAAGLLTPDSGKVHIGVEELSSLSPAQRSGLRASRIGFVFQQFHLVPYLTAYQNILAVSALGNSGDQAEILRKAASLAEHFGLTDRLGHYPAELSTGERQRVALARACANNPKIIMADEPTGNLDTDNANIVLDFLQQFADKGGAVLLVTHDQCAAARAHKIMCLKAGAFSDERLS